MYFEFCLRDDILSMVVPIHIFIYILQSTYVEIDPLNMAYKRLRRKQIYVIFRIFSGIRTFRQVFPGKRLTMQCTKMYPHKRFAIFDKLPK